MFSNNLPEILTPEQVAAYLQVPLEEVLEMLDSGDIPGRYIKGHWRVSKDLLKKWVEQSQPSKTIVTTNLKSSNRNTQPNEVNQKSKSRKNQPSQGVRAESLFREALVARSIKEYNKAKELFNQAIQTNPTPNYYEAYASMEKQVSPEKALALLDEGIERFPNAGELYDLKAGIQKKLGQLELAVETLKRALEVTQKKSILKRLHHSLSERLVQIGDINNFNEAYQHVIEAKKLGMNVEPAVFYKTLRFWKEVTIGQKIFRFLDTAGFKFSVTSFKDEFADILISTQKLEFIDTYKLKHEILLRCFFKQINIKNFTELISTLENATYKNFNREICFVFIQDATPWLEEHLYKLMNKGLEIIIPIDNLVLEKADIENSILLLQQLLDQWYGRRDLFQYQYPVSGRRFYGREADLLALRRNIDDALNTGIYGLRKVGKTSLIRQLQTERSKDIFVYIDLQELMSKKDCNEIYYSICKEIKIKKQSFANLNEQLNLSILDNNFLVYESSTNYAQKFNEYIDNIISPSANYKFEGKVVIVIDEIELLIPLAEESTYFKGYFDFLAHLRGIAQRAAGRFVSIVVAANPIISEQSRWNGRDNPVFQFYREMFLPLLTQEDCSNMISELGRRMSVIFNEESLELIFNETGGHPYITRQLCSHITQKNNIRPLYVDSEIVVKSIDTFLINASAIFSDIDQRLKNDFPLEREILLKIVNGVYSYAELRLLVNSTIDLAIKHLVGYQIIDCQDESYFIKINLLKRWLQKNYF